MKSYHVTAGQGAGELGTRQRPVPEPGPGQVLVRIRANALSLRELLVLEGDHPLSITPGVVAGCEGAGEVVAVGAAVDQVKVGERVAASVFPQWIDGPFRFDYAAQVGSSLGGEVTLVGVSQGAAAKAEPLSAATIFRTGAIIRPLAVGSRRQFLEMNRAVDVSRLKPVIDRTFGFDEVPEALAYYRRGLFFGRVIISHG